MNFPTPHVVGWKKRVLGDPDPRGKRTESWEDPIDVPVIAIYPPTADDMPNAKNKSPVERERDVLAPSWPGKPKDRAVFEGVEWVQVGHPERFDLGPFGFNPGVRISFDRAEEAK